MPAAINPQPIPRRRRRGCGGCFFALLTILVLLGAAWFFVLRPMLHTMAMNQIDTTLSAAVKQIPSQIALMPGGPLTIPEKAINNLLVLNSAPSDPVQNATTSITPDAMRLDFQVYGLPCSITQIPRLQNGQVVATNVSLSGAIALIMSPDDIATLLNRHLAEAQNHIHHPVTALQLKDHEIDLTLG